jgi:hypothetical protein
MNTRSGRTLGVLILATMLVGSLFGAASSYYRMGAGEPRYTFSKPVARPLTGQLGPTPPTREAVRPRIVIDEGTRFDFGVMSRNEQRSHTFVVRNQGNGPLLLSFVDKSCMCTDVTISRSEVPPGESTEITLVWTPSTINPEFEQTARFQTNDPSRIELDLTVAGKVLQLVQLSPQSIGFYNVPINQQREQALRLFAFRDADLQVSRVEWLDPTSSEFLETDITPLSSQELAAETGAVGGQSVTIRLKPGLTLGRYDQRLRLYLNPSDLGPLEIPVPITIAGNISAFGPGYDPQTGVWDLGKLPGDRVHKKPLVIVVRGERTADIQLSLGQTDPSEVLQAELNSLNPSGSPARYQLTLTLTPSKQLINRLGYGQGELAEIVIETTDPGAPEFRIPIAFALEAQP